MGYLIIKAKNQNKTEPSVKENRCNTAASSAPATGGHRWRESESAAESKLDDSAAAAPADPAAAAA